MSKVQNVFYKVLTDLFCLSKAFLNGTIIWWYMIYIFPNDKQSGKEHNGVIYK